jgi:hypothetical protein
MKAGPDAKAAYSQAKSEAQQSATAATPPPPAAPAAPAAPATPAAAPAAAVPAPVASKQSPFNSRVGGVRQVQLMEKVAPRARLRVTVDELAGPDTSPTSEAEVADDGTIALPKLEQRVRVEGLTRAQAQQAIQDAYKAANVVDEPNVTVEPVPTPAPAAVAQRAPNAAGRNAQEQQQQRLQQIPAEAPAPVAQTTQPAGQPSAPGAQDVAAADEVGQPQAAPTSGPTIADEPLDVVILVQRSTPGASTEPGATTPVESAPPNAAITAEPNQAPAPEAAKPAAPAEPAAPQPNAAAPSVPENPAPPAPEAPARSELPAK